MNTDGKRDMEIMLPFFLFFVFEPRIHADFRGLSFFTTDYTDYFFYKK